MVYYSNRYERNCCHDLTFPYPYVLQSRVFGLPVSLDATYKYIYLDQNETVSFSGVGITRSGSTATATTQTPHYLSTGKTVTIAGATQTEYNGNFVVTVISATQFTYTVSGTPATPATGTITAQYTGVHIDDAELVNSFILASMECFEKITRRTLMNATYLTYRNCWECYYELRRSPLVSIGSVKYNDEDDVEQTVDSSLYYTTVDPFYSKLVFEDDFTSPTTNTKQQSISIEFTAGYGTDHSEIPNDIKLAIQGHVMYLWENRGDCPNASDASCMPCQTRTVFEKYKIEEI